MAVPRGIRSPAFEDLSPEDSLYIRFPAANPAPVPTNPEPINLWALFLLSSLLAAFF
jgi:hypothetical protein